MPKSAAATRTRPASPPTRPARGAPPTIEECWARAERGRDVEGLREAERRYGSDVDAEVAAIEAGTHPIHERRRPAQR
jgi:hypothetical protein